jgi:hypothetical protein
LLPSIAAYLTDHLRSKVSACGDQRGFADGVVYVLKVRLRGTFNLTRCSGVQRGLHVRFPPLANRWQIPAEGLDRVMNIEDIFGFVRAITLSWMRIFCARKAAALGT